MCVQVHKRMRRSQRTGVTLVELVIAILLIGLLATVAGLNVPRDERASPTTSIRIAIAAARESAIDSGKAITQVITVRGNSYPVTALPNGSVIADSSLLIDRLSGTVATVARQSARDPHSHCETGAR